MDIIKNYKAMKSASKISVEKKASDTVFKVTRKVVNSRIEQCTVEIDSWTAEKADLEQFKTDAEAL